MNSALKWVIAVIGWMLLLVVFVVWKDAENHMGGGPMSGLIRGAAVFAGAYWIYRWVNQSPKPTEKE